MAERIESRIEMTHRWMREGRWPAIEIAKDARIAHYRANGCARKDAQNRAWDDMRLEYPPQGIEPVIRTFEERLEEREIVEEPPPPPKEPKEPPAPKGVLPVDASLFGGDSEFVTATLWVFDNLAKVVSEGDAPGAGAWALLVWARDNPSDFFKALLPKAIDIQAKRGGTVDESALAEVEECEELAVVLGDIAKGVM